MISLCVKLTACLLLFAQVIDAFVPIAVKRQTNWNDQEEWNNNEQEYTVGMLATEMSKDLQNRMQSTVLSMQAQQGVRQFNQMLVDDMRKAEEFFARYPSSVQQEMEAFYKGYGC